MINDFNCGNSVFSSFKEELINKVGNKSALEILKKGADIYQNIKTTCRNEKKFLMVGKIQSGKTLNFISVMANAIKDRLKLFIVITGLDNELNNQTQDRLKESLRFKENSNFLKFYTSKEIFNNNDKVAEIIKNIDSEKITIITTLKTNVHKISEKFISNNILRNENMLIIDDEGDLASLTHSEKKDSKTYERIKELFENTNSAYLSVTATPHAHMLSRKGKILRPNKVFCINPGEGYQGIEIFANNTNYYSIINEFNDAKDFLTSEIFGDSILYYLLVAANLLLNGDLNEKSHSNMLVHTDAKRDSHKKYKQKIDELINYYKYCLNQRKDCLDYQKFMRRINNIIEVNNLNIDANEKFLEYFSFSLKNLVVSQINLDEKPEINNNFCNIFVGSQLVGRGLTLDNLLVTFFTNVPKGNMAIDTLIQRARWFGYRKPILKYMRIFTTKQIIDYFNASAISDHDIWLKLKKAEKEGTPFKSMDTEIEIDSEKLIPTYKVPMEKQKIKLIYSNNNITNIISSGFAKSLLVKNLLRSPDVFIASGDEFSKYSFKALKFANFGKLLKEIDENILISATKINETVFQKIKKGAADKNIAIIVALLDLKEKNETNPIPRIRNCQKQHDDLFIDNIFQGKNIDTKESENKYVGDIYWHKIKNYENVLFLQIHYIDPQCKGINVLNGKFIYVPALLLPDTLLDYSQKAIFSSKEN